MKSVIQDNKKVNKELIDFVEWATRGYREPIKPLSPVVINQLEALGVLSSGYLIRLSVSMHGELDTARFMRNVEDSIVRGISTRKLFVIRYSS